DCDWTKLYEHFLFTTLSYSISSFFKNFTIFIPSIFRGFASLPRIPPKMNSTYTFACRAAHHIHLDGSKQL
ncbi:hypothetical protein L9F63_018237, partial [Diploptera punctata]